MLPVVGYNRFPDEKGTESFRVDAALWRCYQPVTTVTPMKRGLKASLGYNASLDASYNRFPDEKGTERSLIRQYQSHRLFSKLQPFPR